MNTQEITEITKALSFLIYQAFVEIRLLISMGRTGQAAALADVFHNLAVEMWRDEFELERFRASLKMHLQKFPDSFDYLSPLDEHLAEWRIEASADK